MHRLTRHIADLIPFLLDGGQRLTRLLGGGLVGHRHQRLGLLEEFLLLGQVLLLGRVGLVAVGLTRVEERVGGLAETRPQGVVLVAAGAASLLPTIHQLVELAGGLAPGGRILDLVGLGDDRLLGLAGVVALVVAGLRPLAASLVERGAGLGEPLPQRVRIRLVDADGGALMLLPLLEEIAELVRGRTPVRVVAQRGGQRLGLLHNRGALGHGLVHRGLAGLGDGGLLGGGLGLQLLELRLDGGDVAHHGRFGGLLGQGLERVVDLTVLDVGGLQTVGEQVQLGLQIQIPACVQRQRLLHGGVRELADLAFGIALAHEHGAVVVHAAERLGRRHVGLGIGDGRPLGRMLLRRLLRERRGGGGMRLRHRGRGRRRRGGLGHRFLDDGRFLDDDGLLGSGRRCLLGDFGGVLGCGDILVGHGQLLRLVVSEGRENSRPRPVIFTNLYVL